MCNFFTATDELHLQEVEVVDDLTLQLSFDRVPDPDSLMIYYAYAHNRRGHVVPEGTYPVGAGCLRTNMAVPSQLLEGEDLHDWVAGFEIAPTV